MNLIIGFLVILGFVTFVVLSFLILFIFWLVLAGAALEMSKEDFNKDVDKLDKNSVDALISNKIKTNTTVWSMRKKGGPLGN